MQNNQENNQAVEAYIPPSKGLIMLKATVFALGLVFVVLLFAFILVKNKGYKKQDAALSDCTSTKTILLEEEVQKVELQDGVIVVLTKENKNKIQQIIRIGATCGQEINRVNLKVVR